jgi:hypothetical protein
VNKDSAKPGKKTPSSDRLWAVSYEGNGVEADEELLVLAATPSVAKAKAGWFLRCTRWEKTRITSVEFEGVIDCW